MRKGWPGAVALTVVLGVVPGGPVVARSPALPGAPTAVTAAAGDRSVTVRWTPPAEDGGSPVTGYLVSADPGGTEPRVTGDVTELVVTGLQPGTAYRFTVSATNANGTGPASEPTAAVVPTVVRPQTDLVSGPPPGGFTTSRRARLAWRSDGPVSRYRCTLDHRSLACDGEDLRLRGLRAGTHTFTVAAVDADGDVDPSPATRSWTVPRNDRELDADGPWLRGRDPATYQGTFLRSRRSGSRLTSRGTDVRELVLVATVGPRAGTVAVFLGRHRLGRFDLSAPRRRHRQLVPVASFGGVRTGQVRVVVRSRRKPVSIEGLGVETWFSAP